MSKRFLKSALRSVDKFVAIKGEQQFSHATAAAYRNDLRTIMSTMHKLGSKISDVRDMKPKHVDKLADFWVNESGLSAGRMKNLATRIRWVFFELGKGHLIPKQNKDFNIPLRNYSPTKNLAITEIDLGRFNNPYVRYSIRLEQEFGLRREEALKFQPHLADKGNCIELKPSWTKGGVGRLVPVLTESQRVLLDELKLQVAKGQSLIPPEKSYKQQVNTYTSEVRKAGYRYMHGLRYAYAQKRYVELTNYYSKGRGWKSPLQGGKSIKAMTDDERRIDKNARLMISNELGHSRLNITYRYCGK